jgi:ABC-2 type transport system permease protein
VLIAVLLAVWGATLGEPRGGRAVIRGSRPARAARPRAIGRTRSLFRKELRTWRRDPARIMVISSPIAYGLITALLPLTFDVTLLQPWAGPMIALMAATFASNLYAYDGTALWLTLQTGTEREDVRPAVGLSGRLHPGHGADRGGRYRGERAGLDLAVGPGDPAGAARRRGRARRAGLGRRAGPGPDPRQRAENPLDRQEGIGNAFLVFFAALLPPLPAAGVVLAGTLRDDATLRWAGVPVGLATGVLMAWWLGRIAYQRLRASGPELLFRLRSGTPSGARTVRTDPAGPQPNPVRQTLGWGLGSIALFPQGLVPVVFKLTGNDQVKGLVPRDVRARPVRMADRRGHGSARRLPVPPRHPGPPANPRRPGGRGVGER